MAAKLTFGDRLERDAKYGEANVAVFLAIYPTHSDRSWAHAIYRRSDGTWAGIYVNLEVWKKVDQWSDK